MGPHGKEQEFYSNKIENLLLDRKNLNNSSLARLLKQGARVSLRNLRQGAEKGTADRVGTARRWGSAVCVASAGSKTARGHGLGWLSRGDTRCRATEGVLRGDLRLWRRCAAGSSGRGKQEVGGEDSGVGLWLRGALTVHVEGKRRGGATGGKIGGVWHC